MAFMHGPGSASKPKNTKQGGGRQRASNRNSKAAPSNNSVPRQLHLNPLVEFAGTSIEASIAEAKLKYGTRISSGRSAGKAAAAAGGSQRSGGSGGGAGRALSSSLPPSSRMPAMPQGETIEEKLWREAADRAIAEYEKQKRDVEEQYTKSSEALNQRLEADLAANTTEKSKRGLLFSTLKTDADAQLREATNKAISELMNKKAITISDIDAAIARERKNAEEKIAASKFERSLKKWEIEAGLWADVEKARRIAALNAASARSGGGGGGRRGGGGGGGGSSAGSSQSQGAPFSFKDAIKMARDADEKYYKGEIQGPQRGATYRLIRKYYPEIMPPRIIPKGRRPRSVRPPKLIP